MDIIFKTKVESYQSLEIIIRKIFLAPLQRCNMIKYIIGVSFNVFTESK